MAVVWVVKCGGKTLVVGDEVEVFDNDSEAVQRAIDAAGGENG